MTCKLDMFTKVYLSLQDVIDDIQDKQLKEELQYQYDREKRIHQEEIDKMGEKIYDLEDELEHKCYECPYNED